MGAGSKNDKDIHITIAGLFPSGERTEHPSFLDWLGFEIVTDYSLYSSVHTKGFLQKYKSLLSIQR